LSSVEVKTWRELRDLSEKFGRVWQRASPSLVSSPVQDPLMTGSVHASGVESTHRIARTTCAAGNRWAYPPQPCGRGDANVERTGMALQFATQDEPGSPDG